MPASPQWAYRATARTIESSIAFETQAGLITRIHSIANPQKLAYVASMLGAGT